MSRQVELVRTTTADGIRLDGALSLPSEQPQLGLDAVIGLHGVGSNFYGSSLLEGLDEALRRWGIPLLRINTRGHDTITTVSTPGGPRRVGSALEIVDECRLDLAAWVAFLARQGRRRIGLFGHSLGAIKTLYTAAHNPPESVCCVIAASPPRLSFTAFSNGPTAADFLEAMATAELHVRQGNPQAILETKVPFPLLVGAEAFVDKYGRADRYNLLRFIEHVRCPTLFLYGAVELARGGVAFAGLPEEISARTRPDQELRCTVIPDADHFYTGVRDQMTDEVCRWLASRYPAS